MKKALMFDCETFGLCHNAVIFQVGIVEMDFDTDTVTPVDCLNIDVPSCLQAGLVIEPDTLTWWNRTDSKLTTTVMRGVGGSLETTMLRINNIYTKYANDNSFVPVEVWSCGAKDFQWLESAFKAAGYEAPWPYGCVRDYRTFRNEFADRDVVQPDRIEPAHNALNDALWQAKHLVAIKRQLANERAEWRLQHEQA